MIPNEIALETLREHCSPEQRASLDAFQRFEAVGASGKRYTIVCVGTEVVVSFENTRGASTYGEISRPVWTALVRGRHRHLPLADCALLAKLSIEACEPHWKEMAYMCGNVYVEDMSEQELAAQRAALAVAQQQMAEWTRLEHLRAQGLLQVGTLYQEPGGNRYVWNGQAWTQTA